MKKLSKSILAGILCTVIAITAIMSVNTETVYAAKKTPFTLTFNGKTVKLSNDINDSLKNGVKKVNVKTLKKKWGKVQKFEGETGADIYSWTKGESNITYGTYGKKGSYEWLIFSFNSKNNGICGIKIGMKEATVRKKLNKILDKENIAYQEKGYYNINYLTNGEDGLLHFDLDFTNGKLTRINGELKIG